MARIFVGHLIRLRPNHLSAIAVRIICVFNSKTVNQTSSWLWRKSLYNSSLGRLVRLIHKVNSLNNQCISLPTTYGIAIKGGKYFGLMLIILFAGGSFYQWFPLRGLTSEGWESFSTWHKVTDYAWHMVLPLTALVIGAFATSTLLTKNSFLDEIRKQYVLTAQMKGLSERRVLYGHVFRNAMLIVIAGFPGAFVGALFAGSLLIETIFSLDGLGELSFRAIVGRDYPVVFATLYIFSLLGLAVNLLSDLIYVWIDPRIDFSARAT